MQAVAYVKQITGNNVVHIVYNAMLFTKLCTRQWHKHTQARFISSNRLYK